MQKLLVHLKNEKWENKSLLEIATEIYSGNEVTKAQLGTGNYPAIRYGDIHNSNVCITSNMNFVNPDLIKNKKYCEPGDLIIAKTSEDEYNAGKAAAYLGEKCILGSDILLIKHNQNVKFLAYAMTSKKIRKQISRMLPKSTVMHINIGHLSKIKIPLPPKPIQDLIVDYLDKWKHNLNNLEEKANILLEDRNKQCSFYSSRMFGND